MIKSHDHDLAEWRFGSGHQQKKKTKKKNPVQSKNRARPMAARLIKMSDRNFTQHFDVFMTSLSSDNKITVQQCYICSERCDYSLTYLFKQIVSRGWNPIACSG